MVETISVANAAQLYSALSSAQGGERIELAGGNYGLLELNGLTFPSDVTIVSADPSDPAVFNAMDLNDSSHIILDGIRFEYESEPGKISSFSPFDLTDSSHITIRNSVFEGDLAVLGSDGEYYGSGKGLLVSGSDHIVIENNEMYNWWKAMALNTSTDVIVRGNDVHSNNDDGFNFTRVDGLLVEGNWFHDFRAAPDQGHRDMIQFWNPDPDFPAQNVIIRGNFFDGGTGVKTQTIFMRNKTAEDDPTNLDLYFRNILIEDNVIYNGHAAGISVGETIGLTVINNTLLIDNFMDSSNLIGPQIQLGDRSIDVTVDGNITHKAIPVENKPAEWDIGTQFVVQHTNPNGENYSGDLFVDALGINPSLADLRALAGGLIEQLGVGADLTRFDLIFETGPGAEVGPGPTPDPTPDPIPDPAPDPIPDPAPDPTSDTETGAGGLDDLVIEIWDADQDIAVATLGDGTMLDLALMTAGQTTIAITAADGGYFDGEIGSIRLSVDDLYQKVERAAPYTLFGDKRGDAEGGLALDEGQHTLRVEVFAGKNASSELLGDYTVDFEVDAAPIPDPVPPAPDTSKIGLEDLLIELWDADQDVAIATLGEGTTFDLDLGVLASGHATIAVTAVAGGDLDGQIGSIRLVVDDLYNQVESVSPYTLFGDVAGDAYGGLFLDEGQHTLHLEVYSDAKAKGTLLGDFEIDFAAMSDGIATGETLVDI